VAACTIARPAFGEDASGMARVTYVGHATVEVDLGGTRLLTDPVLRKRVANLRRLPPLPPKPGLLEPDAVLISHAHLDHLDPPSLRLLRPCRVLAPRGCGAALARAGLRDVEEVTAGSCVRLGELDVTAVHMAHDGRRHPLSVARESLGYLIESGGSHAILFAGDTGLFDGLRELAGRVDVALLPVSGWGPRMGPGHMDPAEAARAAAMIRPRVAIPIHWGTLASGRAPWLDDPERPARLFEQAVASITTTIDVRVVAPGDSTEIDPAPGPLRDRAAASSSRRSPPP
jgi:L-ascorbate metabolism protein UlaG (beta-lactamase superfamily)